MVLTRAQNQPGPDGILGTARRRPERQQHRHAVGRPEPDLHLARVAPGVPARVRRRLGRTRHQQRGRRCDRQAAGRASPPARPTPARRTWHGGESTWAAVKKQAHDLLGLLLVDRDAINIPMIATDPYGKFIPGPPAAAAVRDQTTASSRATSRPGTPGDVPVPGRRRALRHAVPDRHRAQRRSVPAGHRQQPATTSPDALPAPDADNTPSADFANQPAGTYDDEMLNAHFACGDGRCNENIALTTIHQIFHSEHDRLVDYIKNVLTANADSPSSDQRHNVGSGRRQRHRSATATASASSRPPAS